MCWKDQISITQQTSVEPGANRGAKDGYEEE